MIEVAEKQVSNAQRIRDYIKEHPFAKAKTKAEALNLPSTYVHSTMWAERKKAKAKKVTLNVAQVELANKLGISVEQFAKGLLEEKNKKPVKLPKKTIDRPKEGTVVGGLVYTKMSNGKFRWLPPAPLPMPEPVQIEMFEPKADPVNHPAHYKVGGIETIDFIEAKKLNYNLGNVVKYLTRADHKGNRKQDLEKAKWYLERELSTMI
jgi:hypothetical protein